MTSWDDARGAVEGMANGAAQRSGAHYEANLALVKRLDIAAGQFAGVITRYKRDEIAQSKQQAATQRRPQLQAGHTPVGTADTYVDHVDPQQLTWRMFSERFPTWADAYPQTQLDVRDDGSWGIYGIERVVTPGDDKYYAELLFGREPGQLLQVPDDQPIDPRYEEVAMQAMAAFLQMLGLPLPT